MKKALFALVCVFAFVCPSMAQGVLPPFVPLAFPSALGTAPNALGYVCTFEAGTSTPLATYSDVGLITANQNPIRLNSAGRPAFGGSEIAVYLLPQTYKISWYAAGGVGSPNCTSSSTMGTLIKTVDNITPQNLYSQVFATKLDDKVCHASQYTAGANAWAKIALCYAVLPSTGGTIDARGLEGAQTGSTTLTFTKPIHLILGSGTYTYSGAGLAIHLNTGSEGSIVEGQGPVTTTLRVSVNGVDAITPSSNSIIRNLTLQGNSTFSSGSTALDGGAATNVQVYETEIKNWGSHGINTGGNDANGYWKVHHNYIHDNYDSGMLMAGVGGHEVHHNRFDLNGSNSIDLNSPNNNIHDNFIDRSGGNYFMAGLDCNAIIITSPYTTADSNIVVNNLITRSQCWGIRIRADDSGHTNYTVVKGNIILANVNSAGGIIIDTSIGALCGTTNYTLISGNQVVGQTGVGILLGGGGAPCVASFSVISENIVVNSSGLGIQVAYGVGATVINNRLNGNGTDTPSVAGSTLAQVCGNRVGAAATASFNCPGVDLTGATLTTTGDVQVGGGLQVGGAGPSITTSSGAPGGACTRGSLYLRNDNFGAGAVLYACENAVWVAK